MEDEKDQCKGGVTKARTRQDVRRLSSSAGTSAEAPFRMNSPHKRVKLGGGGYQ